MPKLPGNAIAQQLAQLEALIAEHPEGVHRGSLQADYERAHHVRLADHIAKRRLAELVRAGRVRMIGSKRGAYYAPLAAAGAAGAPPDFPDLSREGEQVRQDVERPLVQRKPVGYNVHFLEGYLPGRTWYLSEKARVQCATIGRTPDASRPAGTYAREILNQLLIDLSWGSSRLEGNTYTRLDTKNLIELGQRAEGKDAKDAQMILNHKAAIEFLVENAEAIRFDRRTFFTLHAALSENLLGDPADEGRLRRRLVDISGSVYTPMGIPQKIEDCFSLLLQKAAQISDPFEQAFFVMVQLPYLQPFTDVNKRTARLGANISLIKANLCPLSFVDVSERAYVDGTLGVYELNRVDLLRDLFVWAYERSCLQYHIVREALGEPDPIRLRYRNELRAIVHDAVLNDVSPTRRALHSIVTRHSDVASADRKAVADRALQLLHALHEGNFSRYKLRPSEFAAWRRRHPPDDTPL